MTRWPSWRCVRGAARGRIPHVPGTRGTDPARARVLAPQDAGRVASHEHAALEVRAAASRAAACAAAQRADLR